MRKFMELLHAVFLVFLCVLLLVFRLPIIAIVGNVIYYIVSILFTIYMLFELVVLVSYWIEKR